MKFQINSFFEPDLLWEGEIHRQIQKLGRRLGISLASRANLECSLWRGTESAVGLALTLDLENVRLQGKAEDSSELVATRKAFDALNQQFEAHLNRSGEQYFRTELLQATRQTPCFYAGHHAPAPANQLIGNSF
jgi:hypothetical protein